MFCQFTVEGCRSTELGGVGGSAYSHTSTDTSSEGKPLYKVSDSESTPVVIQVMNDGHYAEMHR